MNKTIIIFYLIVFIFFKCQATGGLRILNGFDEDDTNFINKSCIPKSPITAYESSSFYASNVDIAKPELDANTFIIYGNNSTDGGSSIRSILVGRFFKCPDS